MIRIRSILAAAALIAGAAAGASAQQPAPAPAPGPGHRGPRAGMMRHGNPTKMLLHGTTLSAGEQANVQAVQQKYAAQIKVLRQQDRPQMEAARAARQRGDTAAMSQMRQQMMAQRQQAMQLMTAERNDVRAALAPANQSVFDANVAKSQQFRRRGGKKGA
jgi:Spy/CpxP family protein refolding chaperone